MKKIMFNDKYGLTAAVLQGRKTMTRRMIKTQYETIKAYNANFETYLLGELDGETFEVKPCYYIGEVVAVAQSYKDIYEKLKMTHGSSSYVTRQFFHKYIQGGRMPVSNKMFVRAEACFHRIRITDIRIERLQDISDEDCLKEGVYYDADVDGYKILNLSLPNKGWGHKFRQTYFQTPREAFAALIDKVSGKGTWNKNPWLFAYTFELVK